MYICMGTLSGYESDKIIKGLTDAGYAALREAVTSDYKKELPEDRTAFTDIKRWSECAMDDVEVEAWTRIGIPVTMKTVRGLSRGTPHWSNGGVPPAVQVSLMNVGLLEVNLVDYMEDACTDALQGRLDEGWRILCVCPPKDSRRPTYILGRMEKDRRP